MLSDESSSEEEEMELEKTEETGGEKMETMEIFSQTICPQIPVKAFSDPPPSSSIVLCVSLPLDEIVFVSYFVFFRFLYLYLFCLFPTF